MLWLLLLSSMILCVRSRHREVKRKKKIRGYICETAQMDAVSGRNPVGEQRLGEGRSVEVAGMSRTIVGCVD